MVERWRFAGTIFTLVLVMELPSTVGAQESGYQIINGTRVFTQIDHANDRATFSNDCGSQTIARSALVQGAIPTDIIPCPRPNGATNDAGQVANPRESEEKGATALARGIDAYKQSNWVNAELSLDYAIEQFGLAKDPQKQQQAKLYDQAVGCAVSFYQADSEDKMQQALDACPVDYWMGVIKTSLDAAKGDRIALRSGTPSDQPPEYGCSDISGTGNGAPDADCRAVETGWTSLQPTNRSKYIVNFHPARGPDLSIAPGQGLRRLADGSLVVAMIQGGSHALEEEQHCRSLEMSLGFVILSCELARQKKEFAQSGHSDDAYGNYMNSTNSNTRGKNNGNLEGGRFDITSRINEIVFASASGEYRNAYDLSIKLRDELSVMRETSKKEGDESLQVFEWTREDYDRNINQLNCRIYADAAALHLYAQDREALDKLDRYCVEINVRAFPELTAARALAK